MLSDGPVARTKEELLGLLESNLLIEKTEEKDTMMVEAISKTIDGLHEDITYEELQSLKNQTLNLREYHLNRHEQFMKFNQILSRLEFQLPQPKALLPSVSSEKIQQSNEMIEVVEEEEEQEHRGCCGFKRK